MQHDGGRTRLDDIDAGLLAVLRKVPFSSVRTTVDSLNNPASTFYSDFVEKIKMKNFPLLAFHINGQFAFTFSIYDFRLIRNPVAHGNWARPHRGLPACVLSSEISTNTSIVLVFGCENSMKHFF
jgi:hypothetical protein